MTDIVTWCQNWLITSNRATNAKDFEILGRAIVGCSMIVVHPDGSITNGYSYLNRKNSNATWKAGVLIDYAIREYKIMIKKGEIKWDKEHKW